MKKLAGMPSSKIFVTGGASSGKSGFAEHLALELFNKYLNNSNIVNGSIPSTSTNLNFFQIQRRLVARSPRLLADLGSGVAEFLPPTHPCAGNDKEPPKFLLLEF